MTPNAAAPKTDRSLPAIAGPGGGFLEALRAPGPLARPGGGTSDLYAGLIGDWDAEVVDHRPDGTDRRQSAEIHFAWVLEGRAVQDVWIAPARPHRGPAGAGAASGDRCGTTLRVYDPAADAWRITWWNPVTGAENRLVGRRAGSEIVQTGADADGRLIRWVFADVRPDAFRWRGERSEDGGRTWTCDTEFFARRRSAPRDPSVADPPAERRVAWAWTDRPGLETLRLVRHATGVTAEGRILVVLDGSPLSFSYRVEHDERWRFRAARIEAEKIGAATVLEIGRDDVGRFSIDGAPRPDLDRCEDVDLMASPYTNTPAIAAHPLAPGESRRSRVAWVLFPSLEVRGVDQEYARLESVEGAAARYRYRNLESGFTGELTVDSFGLVLDYGPWTRK